MFSNVQQPPAYGSPPFDTYGQSTYPNQYEQIPYVNQPPQPIYDSMPTAPPPPPPMQQQYASQPQFVDNSYMNPQPIYQAPPPPPQQPPPSYAVAVQSPPYNNAPIQQQQPPPPPPLNANNPNLPANYGTASGTPFSPGYKWPRKSIPLICPTCGASVTTRMDTSITFITIIGAILLFLCTCILACLPFCIPACKRTTHYCPYCNSVLGIRKELR